MFVQKGFMKILVNLCILIYSFSAFSLEREDLIRINFSQEIKDGFKEIKSLYEKGVNASIEFKFIEGKICNLKDHKNKEVCLNDKKDSCWLQFNSILSSTDPSDDIITPNKKRVEYLQTLNFVEDRFLFFDYRKNGSNQHITELMFIFTSINEMNKSDLASGILCFSQTTEKLSFDEINKTLGNLMSLK